MLRPKTLDRIEDLPTNALFMLPGTHTLYKKGTNYTTECSAQLLLPLPSRTTVHKFVWGTQVKGNVGPSTLRRYEREWGLSPQKVTLKTT